MSDEFKIAAIVGVVVVGGALLVGKSSPPVPKQPAKIEVVKQQPKAAQKTVPQRRAKPKPSVKAKEKKKTTPRARVEKPKPKPKRDSFCDRVRSEYARMNFIQRMAAYRQATPDQVARGRKCLGL